MSFYIADNFCASEVNDTVVNANITMDVKYNQTDNGAYYIFVVAKYNNYCLID